MLGLANINETLDLKPCVNLPLVLPINEKSFIWRRFMLVQYFAPQNTTKQLYSCACLKWRGEAHGGWVGLPHLVFFHVWISILIWEMTYSYLPKRPFTTKVGFSWNIGFSKHCFFSCMILFVALVCSSLYIQGKKLRRWTFLWFIYMEGWCLLSTTTRWFRPWKKTCPYHACMQWLERTNI